MTSTYAACTHLLHKQALHLLLEMIHTLLGVDETCAKIAILRTLRSASIRQEEFCGGHHFVHNRSGITILVDLKKLLDIISCNARPAYYIGEHVNSVQTAVCRNQISKSMEDRSKD